MGRGVTSPVRDLVIDALRMLGVRRLALSIHDPSFPGEPDEDTGRGSPYSAGARELLRFAAGLGFDAIQLGPQGQTSAGDDSPYDGTLFSRNAESIALGPLALDEAWCGLLPRDRLEALIACRPSGSPTRVHRQHAARAVEAALDLAYRSLRARRGDAPGHVGALVERCDAFVQRSAAWLERDALFAVLSRKHGSADWRTWRDGASEHLDARLHAPRPGEESALARRRLELARTHAVAIDRYAFEQFVVHEQHRELRSFARGLGLAVLGDLQVGVSLADWWHRRALFLEEYLLGAPPSRTNPEGQPWGYPVFDPGQPDEARAFIGERIAKMLAEYDGLRIDHPHGLVCPWVYQAGTGDDARAVRSGARLYASPDLADHPRLAGFSIVSPSQLDRSVPRFADAWAGELTDEQVRRHGALVEVIVEAVAARGLDREALAFEVLSTCPTPLLRVIERFGFGRFRITQKADPRDPLDVYRGENASPRDWIMIGNHDTRPIWLLVDAWAADGSLRDRAAYLATRLVVDPRARPAFAAELLRDPRRVAQAALAEIFVGDARHVLVFFSDLFGLREVYNEPGTVKAENWSLRLAADWRRTYEERRERGEALDVPRALALALRARASRLPPEHAELARALERS